MAALGEYDVAAPDLPCHGGASEGVEKTLEGLAAWVTREHLSQAAVPIGHYPGGINGLQSPAAAPALV